LDNRNPAATERLANAVALRILHGTVLETHKSGMFLELYGPAQTAQSSESLTLLKSNLAAALRDPANIRKAAL
jgi:hypothetical protein